MGINRGPHQRKDRILIWIVVLLLTSTVILDNLLKTNVEQEKRYQARNNLEQIKHCFDNTIKNNDTYRTLYICTTKSKTSFTGDAYVLDSRTLQFVYENSRDVPDYEIMYFTEESVGKTFRDWKSAETALTTMLLGKDSEINVNAEYLFDNSPEWLEWIYLNAPDNQELIVVQGTQEDEVMKQYISYRIFGMGVSFVVCIVILGYIASSARRRHDDRGHI